MIKYSSSIEMDTPPEQVFAYVSDPTTYPQWTDMLEGRYLTSEPAGIGSKAESTMKMGSKTIRIVYEVTDFEPSRKFGFKSTPDSDIFWKGDYSFEPISENKTKITNSGELKLKGIYRLLEPLMAGEVKKGEAAELERLKKLVEAG